MNGNDKAPVIEEIRADDVGINGVGYEVVVKYDGVKVNASYMTYPTSYSYERACRDIRQHHKDIDWDLDNRDLDVYTDVKQKEEYIAAQTALARLVKDYGEAFPFLAESFMRMAEDLEGRSIDNISNIRREGYEKISPVDIAKKYRFIGKLTEQIEDRMKLLKNVILADDWEEIL